MGVATDLANAKANLNVMKGHISKMMNDKNALENAKKVLTTMEQDLNKTVAALEAKKTAAAAGLKKLAESIAAVEATLNGPVFQGDKAIAAINAANAAAVATAQIFDPAKG